MRTPLRNAPQPGLAVVQGTLFGVIFGSVVAGFDLNSGESAAHVLAAAVSAAVVSGAVLGYLMGRKMKVLNQRAQDAAGPLTAEEFTVVSRAARRGPIPTDPHIRQAAERLARYRLEQNVRAGRWPNAAFLGLISMGYFAAAIWGSPWWALGLVVFGFAVVSMYWTAAQLRRRIKLLHEATPARPPKLNCAAPRAAATAKTEQRSEQTLLSKFWRVVPPFRSVVDTRRRRRGPEWSW